MNDDAQETIPLSYKKLGYQIFVKKKNQSFQVGMIYWSID